VNIAQSVSAMKKGQSSLEYLFIIGAVIVMAFIAVKYLEPTAKGVPITGIAYIDPGLSPEKEENKTWIIYRYPPNCHSLAGNPYCDFYVSVSLKTTNNKVYVWAAADENKIRKIKVQLCTGDEKEWIVSESSDKCPHNAPSNMKCKRMIWGKTIPESEFPCTVYIIAWEK